MASKAFSYILTIFSLLLILLPLQSQAVSSKSSSFEFLKNLQGSHKGEQVEGIHELKEYLERFGYLDYENTNQSHALDDTFDDLLEFAIQTYQLNYHLNVTGELDAETISEMMLSRCGVADIINGTTRMLSGHGSSADEVSHYAFFYRMPRWPRTKYHLTYAFLVSTPEVAKLPVHRAFQKWASNTQFTFSLFEGGRRKPDITISFEKGFHGDGFPFDGPGGTLAHAFAPTNGRFHYDGDESWTVGGSEGSYDLETVALHEIGHLLGLQHSSVRDAIMFPFIEAGETKDLHKDDIDGIRFLYSF
ncbi:hypothetical protein FNV43_RR14401 [Rhamnella rubrinervis]|uniref:Peptidase metallopeptidase domain-containing protein n=1 Tax=Rhamnella rubrinervis TaxID=2594499 RepID=A0A8K0H304_9ROSA|nr:hypothetical protein FNV43_RR14401 [Rhamnella rubrinervis]